MTQSKLVFDDKRLPAFESEILQEYKGYLVGSQKISILFVIKNIVYAYFSFRQ